MISILFSYRCEAKLNNRTYSVDMPMTHIVKVEAGLLSWDISIGGCILCQIKRNPEKSHKIHRINLIGLVIADSVNFIIFPILLTQRLTQNTDRHLQQKYDLVPGILRRNDVLRIRSQSLSPQFGHILPL